jgi:GxxExxY protein
MAAAAVPATNISLLTHDVIGAAVEVHRYLGPGLLESAYRECVCHELAMRNLVFDRQVALPLKYKGLPLDPGYRLDLVVAGCIVVELKAVEELTAVHRAQLLTYLRLKRLPLGLLINFNVPTLKAGIVRIANNQ